MESRPIAGPYRGERLLGLGATGAVWRARGPRGVVALKVTRSGPDALAPEAEALRAIQHPHLVRFLQSGPGWLATELVDGVPAHRWASGRATDAILELGLEVLCALRALHDRGLVHGDLKPGNVLVDPWDHAKVIDPMGTPRAGVATPGFAAPEVVRGDLPTAASDAWSFGAVLYTLLAGQPPFPQHEPAAALHAAANRLPLPTGTWRSDLPPAIDTLLLKLLHPEPAVRPSLDAAAGVLVDSAHARPHRPVVGMQAVRTRLLDLLVEARDGASVVVVLHGPQGSGRRTLISEVLRRAAATGLPTLERLDTGRFLSLVEQGERPVAGARATSAEAAEAARRLRASGRGGLLLLHAPAPQPTLAELGAEHLAPESLTRSDAYELARWLGLPPGAPIESCHAVSEGLPRSLWLALEPLATRHTEDRTPFSVPMTAMAVLEALRSHGDVLPLDRLAETAGVSLHELGDLLAMLIATGRVTVDPDGWRVRRVRAVRSGEEA